MTRPKRPVSRPGLERTTHEFSEDASCDHDVHSVRHLGGVVRHHHDLPDADAALHRDRGRPGLLDCVTRLAGLVADRFFATERVMAFLYIVSAALLYMVTRVTTFSGVFWVMLLFCLAY